MPQCPGGHSFLLLTGARVLLSVFGRWAQLLACCLALELESNARQWQCGASCVAELVVGTQPRRPWHHRSPRGDPCVWPSTTSSCLQFVVRRSERVCGSSLCGIWPRVVRRLMWLPCGAVREPHLVAQRDFEGNRHFEVPRPEKFSGLAGANGHRSRISVRHMSVTRPPELARKGEIGIFLARVATRSQDSSGVEKKGDLGCM